MAPTKDKKNKDKKNKKDKKDKKEEENKECTRALKHLAYQVAADPELIQLLERSYISEERDRLTARMQDLLPQELRTKIKKLYDLFSTVCQ
jgi:hypothetical protein